MSNQTIDSLPKQLQSIADCMWDEPVDDVLTHWHVVSQVNVLAALHEAATAITKLNTDVKALLSLLGCMTPEDGVKTK